MTIKGIVFDLDGVFFLHGHENFIKNVSRIFSVPKEKVTYAYKKSKEMNKYYKTGKWDGNKFWSWFCKELGIESSKEELIDILSQGYEINQDALKVCRKLRKNRYKTLVCSNNFPERVEMLNKKFNFLDEFDVAVFSFEVGVLKPDKKIYEELCKRSGLKPEEIFLADDNEKNIESAKKFGIHAIFYTDFNAFVDRLRSLGVMI